MSAYKTLIRPILFGLPLEPETIHDLVSRLLPWAPTRRSPDHPALAVDVGGVRFPGPIGLAAGFDKDCRTFAALYNFDFGSVEVGTVTPAPQRGNPRPRIARLEDDQAIINRMGFPNDGMKTAISRIDRFLDRPGPLGVNIGANKESADRIGDYLIGLKAVSAHADYVTINVSSPNTPNLRNLESTDELPKLLCALDREIADARIPVFLKLSPDLNEDQIRSASEAILQSRISGIIVGNTTLSRPEGLMSKNAQSEVGGLSGKPLRSLSIRALELFRQELGSRLPIISVGGIATAEDAYDRIKRGASLVQIYTSFIYEGPGLVKEMNARLVEMLHEDGYTNIADAVGVGSGPARPGFKAEVSFPSTGYRPAMA